MSDQAPSEASAPRSTGPVRTVRAVVNAASGSVGRDAARRLHEIVAASGREIEVADAQPREIESALVRAVEARPDLLVVLAGDGTARLAGQLCGADGPLVAPLPGGTMNMLPKAFYGARTWEQALTDTLQDGAARTVSGGAIGGRPFYVAAILGAPALWAPAREALREGRLRLAWLRGRRALKRAFSGQLRFALDDGAARRAEALTLMCPLVSRALDRDDALEACALNPHGAAEAFRLGARTLLSTVVGDWRQDPAVTVEICRVGRAWARGRIPAILDGEPHRFDPDVEIRFVPNAFRALAPAQRPSPEETQREPEKLQAKAALGAAADEAAREL